HISGVPADGAYPFNLWEFGEVVRDPIWVDLRHSEGLETGLYYFNLIVSWDNGDLELPLGTLELIKPEAEP
ncbi:MAG: hypothetical protein N2508_11690, partial [Anaerolineae bacterium]|nr:hypothetical protein [Anaerolineae bacterium]